MKPQMRERIIMHIDMNAFYASVAQHLDPRTSRPTHRRCGRPQEAKRNNPGQVPAGEGGRREDGLRIWEAKKVCPDITIVPPDYAAYKRYSRLARMIYYDYTDLVDELIGEYRPLAAQQQAELRGLDARALRYRLLHEPAFAVMPGHGVSDACEESVGPVYSCIFIVGHTCSLEMRGNGHRLDPLQSVPSEAISHEGTSEHRFGKSKSGFGIPKAVLRQPKISLRRNAKSRLSGCRLMWVTAPGQPEVIFMSVMLWRRRHDV